MPRAGLLLPLPPSFSRYTTYTAVSGEQELSPSSAVMTPPVLEGEREQERRRRAGSADRPGCTAPPAASCRRATTATTPVTSSRFDRLAPRTLPTTISEVPRERGHDRGDQLGQRSAGGHDQHTDREGRHAERESDPLRAGGEQPRRREQHPKADGEDDEGQGHAPAVRTPGMAGGALRGLSSSLIWMAISSSCCGPPRLRYGSGVAHNIHLAETAHEALGPRGDDPRGRRRSVSSDEGRCNIARTA